MLTSTPYMYLQEDFNFTSAAWLMLQYCRNGRCTTSPAALDNLAVAMQIQMHSVWALLCSAAPLPAHFGANIERHSLGAGAPDRTADFCALDRISRRNEPVFEHEIPFNALGAGVLPSLRT